MIGYSLEKSGMKIDYIAQPDEQLGKVLSDLLGTDPPAKQVVFVSAFAALQTVMRLKTRVLKLKTAGIQIRFVVGIDLGGTSQEVLRELLTWDVDVRIVKHKIPGYTFHPKIYFFEWDDRALFITGSNNLTDGGLFRNYEGAVRVTYDLPKDEDAFRSAYTTFRRFLDPTGPISYKLTTPFLEVLIRRGDVPTEAEARKRRADAAAAGGRRAGKRNVPSPFGTEEIKAPPPLPADVLEALLKDVRERRKKAAKKPGKKKTAAPIDPKIPDELAPAAFFMTLPKLQGPNIPGEGRIPLEAIELAKDFWGWPDEYAKVVTRSKEERVYWNWRPKWKVWSVEDPGNVVVQEVRMYMYENSSDFRFYVRPLIVAGGDTGDVIRMRRLSGADAEFECVLARKNTAEHADWIKACTQKVRNSDRRFGYA